MLTSFFFTLKQVRLEMQQAPGHASASKLFCSLERAIGSESFRLVGEFGPTFDSFGFHLLNQPRYLFSVSTQNGEMPIGRYDFQVSIIDDSLENGEIVFLEDVELERLLEVVHGVSCGTIA
jgi:hypothetical protein